MRMSSQMSGSLQTCLLLVSIAIATPAITAEQQRPEATPPAEPVKGQAAPPKPRASTRSSTFTPSEKIKADSSVSFPVDI